MGRATSIDLGSEGGGIGEPSIGPSVDPATLDGTGNIGADGFDPAIHVSRDKRNGDGSFTRKRGRRAGSRNSGQKSSTADLKTAIDGLSRTLIVLHTGLAYATQTPDLVIDSAEAEMLAQASVNVMQEFDIAPDPKTQAIIGLLMACGMIYGPRIYVIRQKRMKKADAEVTSSGPIPGWLTPDQEQPLN